MNFIKAGGNTIAVRPEDIEVNKGHGPMEAVVRTIMMLGHYVVLTVQRGNEIIKCYVDRELSEQLREGDIVNLSIGKHTDFFTGRLIIEGTGTSGREKYRFEKRYAGRNLVRRKSKKQTRRNEKMKMKKVMAAMLAGMMMVSMVGCGAGSQTSADASDSAQTKESTDGKSTLTIWASGSDNVRQVFEALIDDLIKTLKCSIKYQAELQFMLSGTGTQSMTDMLAAAYKAKQTNTDYDLVDLGGDDLSKVVSQIGEEAICETGQEQDPECGKCSSQELSGR